MVQTFLIEESKELIYDSDKIEEWKEKCSELGLNKQLDLCAPDKSPVPFEFMNTVTMRVYEQLCPAKSKYKEYDKTAIPLEVLSLIALAERERYFESIEIWYDDKSPDPLAVGYIKKGEWSRDLYLIARWGDVLRPFEELKERAISLYQRVGRLNLERRISESQYLLANIETNTALYFEAQTESYNVVGF